MTKEEVQKLARLRANIINCYNGLEEPQQTTSVMNTRDAAHLCEEVISSIDTLLKQYVTFE